MNKRSPLAALLISLVWATTSHASYSFTISFEPSPGPGGLVGNVLYQAPSYLNGGINAAPFYALLGINTPSHPGGSFAAYGVTLEVSGGTGGFEIGGPSTPFTGQVSNFNVGPMGGSFLVTGFLGDGAASFYGVPPATQMTGLATIQFLPPQLPSYGNERAFLQFTFTPTIPEPASLIATSSGLIIVLGYAGGRRRRAARGSRGSANPTAPPAVASRCVIRSR